MAETAVIELDGSSWRTRPDFYSALLSALGAPSWHGHNLDALNDSLRGGDINRVNAPLQVTIFLPEGASAEVVDAARKFVELCDDLAEDGFGVDAAIGRPA